jgi:hypothetical protein
VSLGAHANRLFEAHRNGSTRIVELRTGIVRELSGPGPRTTAAAFSNDGSRVAAARDDGLVTVWETGSGGRVEIGPFAGKIATLAVDTDGAVLAVTDKGGRIAKRGSRQFEEVSGFTYTSIYSVAFDRLLPHVAIFVSSSGVEYRDLETGSAALFSYRTGEIVSPARRSVATVGEHQISLHRLSGLWRF